MQTKYNKLVTFVGSRWAFAVTTVLFAIEASWLAITSRFPMAYDEAYHLGLVRFFSHHLNPIITSQDTVSLKYGAIVQGPSFLYHYLLSFPYQIISHVTDSQVVQVVCLRLINVAFAVATLFILRKLMHLIHIPASLANILLLVFALVPAFTVLSAQINYDNLLILLATFCLYQMVQFCKSLDANRFETQSFLLLVAGCLFASLTKYAFLPLFFGIAVCVVYKLLRYKKLHKAHLLREASRSFSAISSYAKVSLLLAITLSGLLFCRVYAVNVVRYHTPVPQCNQVLSVPECAHYYSWQRNYTVQQEHLAHPAEDRLTLAKYSAYWLVQTSIYIYGAIKPLMGFLSIPPLYFMAILLFSALGTITGLANLRKILKNYPQLGPLLIVSLFYVLFLWARNYHDYVQLGTVIAVNGRYLLPVLPYFFILFGLGVHTALAGRQGYRPVIKTALGVFCVSLFIAFGGFMQNILIINPLYGPLNSSNNFTLSDSCPSNSIDPMECDTSK